MIRRVMAVFSLFMLLGGCAKIDATETLIANAWFAGGKVINNSNGYQYLVLLGGTIIFPGGFTFRQFDPEDIVSLAYGGPDVVLVFTKNGDLWHVLGSYEGPAVATKIADQIERSEVADLPCYRKTSGIWYCMDSARYAVDRAATIEVPNGAPLYQVPLFNGATQVSGSCAVFEDQGGLAKCALPRFLSKDAISTTSITEAIDNERYYFTSLPIEVTDVVQVAASPTWSFSEDISKAEAALQLDGPGYLQDIPNSLLGFSHCFLTSIGEVFCSGTVPTKAIGLSLPDSTSRVYVSLLKPRKIEGLPSSIKKIMVHYSRACAGDDSGKTWCWGLQPLGYPESQVPISREAYDNMSRILLDCILYDDGRVRCPTKDHTTIPQIQYWQCKYEPDNCQVPRRRLQELEEKYGAIE